MNGKKSNTSMTTRMADQVLACNLFPEEDQDMGDDQVDQEEKKKDPLSSQVWRMYTKAKDTLPNGSRLENLTWRMMAMTLKKQDAAQSPSTSSLSSEHLDTASAPKLDGNKPIISESPPMVNYTCPHLLINPVGWLTRYILRKLIASIFP